MQKLRVAIYPYLLLNLILLSSSINTNPVHAAAQTAIQVTTPLDQIAEDEFCSLREAIRSANLDLPVGGCPAGAGTDTILVPAGTYQLTIPGADEDDGLTGDLDIVQGLTLMGDGAGQTILDGGGHDRVLHISEMQIGVVLRDLTVQNGLVEATDLLGGGGVLSLGDLSLERVELKNNAALRGGGARNSQGVLNVLDSTITGNTAFTEGGGIYGDGVMTIARAQFIANQAEYGGGINSDEAITLSEVTLSQNQAAYFGGGLFNDSNATIQGVLFDANAAPHGGGFYNNHSAVLTNATFSNNISERGMGLVGRGGAIFNTAELEIHFSTLNANRAEQGGNLYNAEGGTVSFLGSILAAHGVGNCVNLDQLISLGYNIADDALCELNSVGDRANLDPHLAPLADNLGFTPTHALLPNSPALDSGPAEGCPATDQRGVIRAIDGDRDGAIACDIGAFEHAPGGILYFEPGEQSYAEQEADVEIWVSRFGGDGTVAVEYRGGAGSAILGADFALTPGNLNWTGANHAAQKIQARILDDEYREGDETGSVLLLNPSGQAGLLFPYDRFSLVILANDPQGPLPPGGLVYLPLLQH